MKEESLKLVLLFNPEVRGYKRAAHNLTADQATKEFGTVGAAKIIDQGRRHSTPDPLKCKTCQSAALKATREQNESAREGTHEQEAAEGVAEADKEPVSQAGS
ncbi:MAG TPA: hypothetical protein VFR24_25335 [Candidatus Angelobacter sp.]|nr:hypothetical protein [Candidatus Angelobacter sp.]